MLANIITFAKALLASALTNEGLITALKGGVSSVAFTVLEYLGKQFFPKVAPAMAPAAAAVLFDPETTKWIQEGLNSYFEKSVGYVALAVDGDYGPKTRAAVAKFQQALGLLVDEWAGERTKAALAAVLQGFKVTT